MTMTIKGYNVPDGYMGYTNDGWMLFATDGDYLDYMDRT